MEFAYVSVQGWIIDPYEQCFFYCSVEVLVFPPHYTKVIYGDTVTSGYIIEPILEVVTSVEQTCQKLVQGEAEEL